MAVLPKDAVASLIAKLPNRKAPDEVWFSTRVAHCRSYSISGALTPLGRRAGSGGCRC